MILVQQKFKHNEHFSVAPFEDWNFNYRGCAAVRPARYIRLFPAMFIYDDPFAEYQLPIPANVYEYVGLPDTGLHDNAINEVADEWFGTP